MGAPPQVEATASPIDPAIILLPLTLPSHGPSRGAAPTDMLPPKKKYPARGRAIFREEHDQHFAAIRPPNSLTTCRRASGHRRNIDLQNRSGHGPRVVGLPFR